MLTTLYDDRYHTNASGPTLISTTKQRAVVRAALAEGLLDLHYHPTTLSPAWREVAVVHSLAYITAVQTGRPRDLAESQGFRWSQRFAASVARIFSGQIAACKLAESASIVFHPVSGAHHAVATRGRAFCTFNFLAGAALLHTDRSAIVDLDAHQGDGTFDLVGGHPRIGLFDISYADWGVRPTEWHQTYTIAHNADEYFAQLAKLPAFLDDFNPTLVQYQAAMDCFEGDDMGRIPGMTAARLGARDRYVIQQVRGRGIPLVINLGGGYVDETVALHVQTARIAADEATR